MKDFDFEHLRRAEETHFEHMVHASSYSLKFAMCSLFCMFHAIFPFYRVDYGSKRAKEIIENVKQRQGE